MPRVSQPGAAPFTRATFVIEDGVPGLQEAGVKVPAARRVERAPGKDRIVRDTIREETGGGKGYRS